MASDRKEREKGILSQLRSGFAEGMRVTPEDRRDMLWFIRDAEGKSEPPRAAAVLATQPSIDVLRQAKTIDPEHFGWLPLKPMTDQAFMERANAGMNFGPSPKELIGRELQLRDVGEYKQLLKQQGIARKAGYLGGNIATDLVNDSTRAIWWLINASQAVTNLSSEWLAAGLNPDLFARREVDLDEARAKGWVTYNKPDISQEIIDKRAREIEQLQLAQRSSALNNSDFSEKALSDFYDGIERDASKRARQELEAEAVEDLKNYVRARPGVKIRGKRILKNRFNPNLVNAATIVPAALGINAGIGLLNRQEGYAMTVPQDDDPFSTENVIAEVAARYLTGREGRLLEAEDFLLERPDVSYGEYQAYRNYLRDRDLDMNPFDDGKVNFGGILKTNPEGIRGAEVSFMGKSLPVADTLMPTVGAVLGTAAGAALTNAGSIRMRGGWGKRKGLGKLGALVPEVLPRTPEGRRVQAHPMNKGLNDLQSKFDNDDGPLHNARVLGTVFGGGMAGLAAGNALGTSIEDERRRRNFEERNPGVDYETYKANAKQLLQDKYELMKANPNADEEKAKSRTGFNKRNQQQALNTKALQQQTMIDQIIDADRRAQAQKAMGTMQWALEKSSAIDQEIARRNAGKQDEEQPSTLIF